MTRTTLAGRAAAAALLLAALGCAASKGQSPPAAPVGTVPSAPATRAPVTKPASEQAPAAPVRLSMVTKPDATPANWRPDPGHGLPPNSYGRLANDMTGGQLTAADSRFTGSLLKQTYDYVLFYQGKGDFVAAPIAKLGDRCMAVRFARSEGLIRGALAVCSLGPKNDQSVIFEADWPRREDMAAVKDFEAIVLNSDLAER